MKLYPFDVPDNWHPYSWLFFGTGLTEDQIRILTKRIVDDLGMRPVERWETKTYSWAVGVQGEFPDRITANVGDVVDLQVAEFGAVQLAGGAPPPGVRLEKHSGKLVGVLTHTGLYSVSIGVGPTVKYDPLGSPGGPGDPGIFIPLHQPRQEPDLQLERIPLSVSDLSDRDKDHALAELMAWSDGVTIKEADQ